MAECGEFREEETFPCERVVLRSYLAKVFGVGWKRSYAAGLSAGLLRAAKEQSQ